MAAVALARAALRVWRPDGLGVRVGNQAGTPLPGGEISVRGETGEEVPADGRTMGDLYIRGPYVTDRYVADESPESFAGGWFKTGDVAVATADGYFTIADRTKDLIKSGGEWISSVDMESAIMGLPSVVEAAVIAIPDDRWGERPLPCVALADGASLTLEGLRDHLSSSGFARWQLPDRMQVVDVVPKTAVGKFDKKVLRRLFAQPASETVAPTEGDVGVRGRA
jgi:fatty-acyl-CoA synthase